MTTGIDWKQLDGQTRLPDGDRIAVQVTPNAVSPDSIQIQLQLAPGVTWWKGLQASEIVLDQCQDTQNFCSTRMSYAEFRTRAFTKWKAKAFGIHTAMYTLNNQNDFMTAGNSYLFEWLGD